MQRHVVKQGECVASIAFAYGFHPDTIWEAPENESLRQQRSSPHVLLPGDELVIPQKRKRTVSAPTGARHVFRRRAVPEIYRARFVDAEQQPRAGVAYTFKAGSSVSEGTLDADGSFREWIPPDCDAAEIILTDNGRTESYRVVLGQLAPVSELRGVQARLNALGYHCGAASGEWNHATELALQRFQESAGLAVTKTPDDATRAKLVALYGV